MSFRVLNYNTLWGYKGAEMNNQQTVVLAIEGMSCGGCESQVTKTLAKVADVSSVSVSLAEKTARVQGENLDVASLISAVEGAGFRVKSAI